ncbi:hypothetical protein ACIRVK_14475 [Streptomyces sp. NPDC101152]|uniref:hypothetical protein n=1 Tax=Streptomyces sp. NPDC101152 TaxID=3366116 RepID=UPI0037F51C3F
MHSIQRPIRRSLAAGVLSLALLSAGTAGAFASEAKPKPSASMSAKPSPSKSAKPSPSKSAKPSPSKSTAASITITVNKTSVKAGNTVTFTGRTKGLKVGTLLVLQHQKGTKWTTLKASTTVKKGSSYSLTAKLNTKGTEHLRISAGTVHSPVVTVTVK